MVVETRYPTLLHLGRHCSTGAASLKVVLDSMAAARNDVLLSDDAMEFAVCEDSTSPGEELRDRGMR